MFMLAAAFILISRLVEVVPSQNEVLLDVCGSIMEIANGTQVSEDILKVKFTKREKKNYEIITIDGKFISHKTGKEFVARMKNLTYPDTFYYIIKELDPNETYTLNITYKYKVDNGSCTSTTSSIFTKRDVCGSIMEIANGTQVSEDILKVKFTKREKKNYEIITIDGKFISHKTGKEFVARMKNLTYPDTFYYTIKELDPNETYTLNITFKYKLDNGSCTSTTSSIFTKRDVCGSIMEIANGTQVSEDILKVKFTKREKKNYEIITIDGKFISHKTGKEFVARMKNLTYPDTFYYTIKELDPNETYTLNITFKYKLDNGSCTSTTSSIFTKRDCGSIMEIANGTQVSEDILKVKFTKREKKWYEILTIDGKYISHKTGKEFVARMKNLTYPDTFYYIIKELDPNESYTLNITYKYKVDNGSCTSTTSSIFTKRDVCGSIMEIANGTQVSEDILKVKFTKREKKNYEIITIDGKFISHKTGKEFVARMKNLTYSDTFYYIIKELDPNESYTLNITYKYKVDNGSCTSTTSSIFTKRDIRIVKKNNNIYLFIVAIVIVSIVITLMLVYTGQKSKLELLLEKVKILLFPWYSSTQDSTSEFSFEFADSSGRQEINPLYQPLEQCAVQNDDPFEFPREKIELKEVIGEGEFGEVHYAKAYGMFGLKGYIMVAVKQMKSNPSQQARADFLMEINTLKKIGRHSNIVQMLGCVTQSEPFMIIMELIRNGNLKDYLLELRKIWDERKNTKFFDRNIDYSYVQPECEDNVKKSQSNEPEDNIIAYEAEATTPILAEANPPPFPVLDHMELQYFASQIACGMAHLEKIGITHRDLAARNILITKEKLLKITDFGMSRPGPYVNTNMERRIPLRWCSIEAIKELKTNNKSDVWSFGVVLWEIGTLGAFPYGNMVCNEIIYYLKSGNRLGRPEICTDELYDVMLRCWRERPEDRPSFSDLVKLLDAKKRHVYVEFQKISPNYIFPETCSEE